MKIALIILAVLSVSIVIWMLMLRRSRKFYERLREDADLEKDKELIEACNYALDRVNRQHIYFHYRLHKLKKWLRI